MNFSKQENRRKARSHHGYSDSLHNNSLYEAYLQNHSDPRFSDSDVSYKMFLPILKLVVLYVETFNCKVLVKNLGCF